MLIAKNEFPTSVGEAPSIQHGVGHSLCTRLESIDRGFETDLSRDEFEHESSVTMHALRRDALAGTVTGLVAIPLTVGICLMSEYPVQVGLATVVVACVLSFALYFVRPGNHVGVPGVAAGLAPILALGIEQFGRENMPWLIFLTSVFQAIIWRFNLSRFILKAVPHFLIEGLLAGVGLKIAMKFLPYTYETAHEATQFWTNERLLVILSSVVGMALFVYLFGRFKKIFPALPYLVVIGGSVVLARFASFPMLHVEPFEFVLAWPFPNWDQISLKMHLQMVLYASMLMTIDVIEQVMSNAAIEQMDPLGRKSNSNNSLIVMWLGNMCCSFFGGMTNLDGLAKSSTNRMAGALTKTSNLFVGAVLGVVVLVPSLLGYLPEFSLAILMVFIGWKMVAGLYNVAHEGRYAFGLALVCGLLVFEHGIFEGLIISLIVHSFIVYIVFKHDHMPTIDIFKKLVGLFLDKHHPLESATMRVATDQESGGVRFSSVCKSSSESRTLDDFIADWAFGVNHHNLLSVVGTYDSQGLLWGTFAKELRSGHSHIRKYFEHLFELTSLHVDFISGETRQYGEIHIRSGAYQFTYHKKSMKHVVPARYSFVCKKERTGWYILEHHSSEFPA